MKKRTKKNTVGKSLAIVRHFFPKVQRVVDATKGVIVEVTKNDDAVANVKDHNTCALAVACKRAFKADGVIIGLTVSYIVIGDTATRYTNTQTISREITSFDRKAGFDLGFYKLSPMSETRQFGSRRDTTKERVSGKGMYRELKTFKHYTKNVRTALGGVPA